MKAIRIDGSPAGRATDLSEGASFLRRVPVFAELSPEVLERLAGEASAVDVGAGEWLLREGDPAKSLFVVRSGRLEIVSEGPPETLIRVLRRGDVLGELALLQEETRSASVRARRDTSLLELSRGQFESLIREEPKFAVGLTRAMGAQLAASRAPALATAPPRTIAVLALDEDAPASQIGEQLVEALRAYGSVTELGIEHGLSISEMALALDQSERDFDRVVLVAGPAPGELWTEFCVGEADVVLALTSGSPDPGWLERRRSLQGCRLLCLGGPVGSEVLTALEPEEVELIREQASLPTRIEAAARRLAGRAIGLVLSGGGARALAHLGVLEELATGGVVVDRIGGVSLGAVVAAGVALERGAEEISELFRTGFIKTNPTGDYTLPLYSLIRGHRADELLKEFLGDTLIEELPIRFYCQSCDLVTRTAVVHKSGPLFAAVRASLSIPGVFPPIPTSDGRLLVDGGVLDNLPVQAMARSGEGPVIAVDVSGRIGDFRQPTRPGIARLSRPARRYLTGTEAVLPRLGETMMRTVTVGSIDTAEAARRHADLVIEPEVDGIGMLDWRQLERVQAAGRKAARAALANSPAWLGS